MGSSDSRKALLGIDIFNWALRRGRAFRSDDPRVESVGATVIRRQSAVRTKCCSHDSPVTGRVCELIRDEVNSSTANLVTEPRSAFVCLETPASQTDSVAQCAIGVPHLNGGFSMARKVGQVVGCFATRAGRSTLKGSSSVV